MVHVKTWSEETLLMALTNQAFYFKNVPFNRAALSLQVFVLEIFYSCCVMMQ